MFAIIKTGGKQYKVKQGDKIKVGKLKVEEGKEITFDDVLLVADDDKNVKIGKPNVRGAKVVGKVTKQERDKKVIVFKYKSKKRYHKKQGHRQHFSEVEISKIAA